MPPDWGAFEARSRQMQRDAFGFPTVTVYNYTGGYDPSTGETDWTRDSGTDVAAEIVVPSEPELTTGPDGQESEVDAVIRIADDEGVDIIPIGTPDAKPTEIEYDGRAFVVAEATDAPKNGLIRAKAVEA